MKHWRSKSRKRYLSAKSQTALWIHSISAGWQMNLTLGLTESKWTGETSQEDLQDKCQPYFIMVLNGTKPHSWGYIYICWRSILIHQVWHRIACNFFSFSTASILRSERHLNLNFEGHYSAFTPHKGTIWRGVFFFFMGRFGHRSRWLVLS